MKSWQIWVLSLLVILIAIWGFTWLTRNTEVADTLPDPDPAFAVEGCYVVRFEKDVYTLNITSQSGEEVLGTLEFDNFEKDSSSGTFAGTYRDQTLLGDYSFQSEGTNSVMQVAFQRQDDDFVRGYGPLDPSGTRFANLDAVTYDASAPLSLFKKEDCPS